MLERVFELAREERRAFGVEGVVWFTWMDDPGVAKEDNFNASSGLLGVDGEEKPAFESFLEQTGGS
jgi:hypothetical protein